MPKSKAPRKARRTVRGGIPMTIRFGAEDARTLKLIPHQSLDRLRRGVGEESDWHTLAARLNLGAVMSMRYEEYAAVQPDMARALDALRSIRARGRWDVASGDELKAIGVALYLIDDMQDGTTRRDLADSMAEVYREAAL